MRDYKLSEIQDLCKEQRKNGCSECPILQFCLMHFKNGCRMPKYWNVAETRKPEKIEYDPTFRMTIKRITFNDNSVEEEIVPPSTTITITDENGKDIYRFKTKENENNGH